MPKNIDRAQVQELLSQGARLVEVLPSKQYRQVHLASAVNLPLQKLNRLTAGEFDKDKPIIVYCYDHQ